MATRLSQPSLSDSEHASPPRVLLGDTFGHIRTFRLYVLLQASRV